MAHMGRILNWSRIKSGVLSWAINAVYRYERLVGWRRMVTLRMPARRNPLGTQNPRAQARPGAAQSAPHPRGLLCTDMSRLNSVLTYS